MRWTDEQLRAVKDKNGNILVSAAAGSGKTAVLVERIIRLITDEKESVDIDRLLVVTFTRAAASEMKERIGAAISRALTEKPESVNLRRQAVLLNRADITTIHSFCLRVARENYNRLGIDPAFRVADDTETALLREEVIDDLFEDMYASDDPDDFLYLVENYSNGISDRKLKDLVLRIYDFLRSFPDPEGAIERQKKGYEGGIDFWSGILKEQIRVYIKGALELTGIALDTAHLTGPETYIPALENDIEQMKEILEAADEDMAEFYSAIRSMTFTALSRKKCDSPTKEKVKGLRDKAKKIFSSIGEKFLVRDPEEMEKDISEAKKAVFPLLDLVREFGDRFSAEKRQRRIADYGDLEHYCLTALTEEGCDMAHPVKSEAAKELTEKYIYVMTDEYQDSNAVQETVLNLVSNGANRFMVGDVKQSIYGFRLADPDIFTEKYNAFSLESGAENERIDMFSNFRSRKEILDGINFIFMQLMQRELGGIDYDEKASLHAGAEFPKYMGEAKVGGAVEIDVIKKNIEEEETAESDEEEGDAGEREMNFVADRINGLMYGKDRLEVYDAGLGDYRPLRFSDIVIIMRKKTKGADFVDILRRKGIPASADVGTGFLETPEIMTILSFLRIIDNPRQDIPLASALRSMAYGLTADELLTIKLESGLEEFWECVNFYAENGRNSRIRDVLRKFLTQLNGWRNMAIDENINDLIWAVYTQTGYYDMVGVLPEGKLRQMNLLKLVQKASDYDSISFKGLFDFIRYIEKIDKNDVELDTASGLASEGVRIMTIHRSKGLEFPVVFLSGCGGYFNRTDSGASVVLHKELGIGAEYTDIETRIRYNPIPRIVISEKLRMEAVAEEMRILYVAMTRAKEKLIITGTSSIEPSNAGNWNLYAGRDETGLPVFDIASRNSYMDWLLMALARHRDGACLLNGEGADAKNGLYGHESEFELNFIGNVGSETVVMEDNALNTEEDRAFLRAQIEARLNWQYPYEEETTIPGTVSVSDVKRMRGIRLTHTIRKPDFYSDTKGLSASERGTAFHRVLERMDFRREYSYPDVKALVDECRLAGILSEAEAEAISVKKIQMFTASPLYKRIMSSEQIFKEEAFTVAVKPLDIYGEEKYAGLDGDVILHGRADCYFVENGEVVLIDYKTDRYNEDSEEEFHERYDIQMELYSRALEKVTGMRVKECYIFSLESGKAIPVGV